MTGEKSAVATGNKTFEFGTKGKSTGKDLIQQFIRRIFPVAK
jgi:hypothetical protein